TPSVWGGGHATIVSAMNAQKSIVTITALKKEQPNKSGEIATSYRQGAGVIVDPSGIIITNLHTIAYMNQIEAKLYDGASFKAKIIHLMPQHDLALLKINSPRSLIPIEFADSNKVRLGQNIINAGHSKWLRNTLSGGKIIGLGRNKIDNHLEILEINVDLYEGDSGGPVLDRQGRLLGIMTAKRNDRNNMSFAIPSNEIGKLYLDYLKRNR
ncbi:hypothetical protein MNBD_BACTEROID05-776, partial [hydrothermal vent metagenome]